MTAPPREPRYRFGPFCLDPAAQTLHRAGEKVPLTPRVFETLLCLVRNAGRVVERDELLRQVWHGRAVDESNIKQAIFALRRALNDPGTLILTAPTRGYKFAADIRAEPVTRRRRARTAGAAAIALAATMGAALLAVRPRPEPAASPAPAHSVAVLPFTNLSNDPAQTYFSDGIAAELISTLARIPDLRVAARTSSFALRNQNATVPDIAARLHVASVLEGTVRREGARLRITAELADARTGFTLWTRDFDRDAHDLLRIQAEIAAAITAALRVRLLDEDATKLLAGGTQNPAAYDAYLHAAAIAEADPDAALASFAAAIALDPNFAAARARRAQTLLYAANSGGPDPIAFHSRIAEAVAQSDRAVALAPSLALAHIARAAALMATQRFVEADREYTLAHALGPSDAAITLDYALAQAQFGRLPAAVRAAQDAVLLDPLRPLPYEYLGSILASAHRDAEAHAALTRALLLGDPAGASAIATATALQQGNYANVLAHCGDIRNWRALFCRALALQGLGRAAEAAAARAELTSRLGDNGAYQYAELAARSGDTAGAIAWLETAWRRHDTGLAQLKTDPLLAPLRAAPAFRAIQDRLAFPQ